MTKNASSIILIVADDFPRNILGSYGATHGLTPTIDGIGSGGSTFTAAYTVAPLCTPSRFALLTGQYASRGARDRSGPSDSTDHSATPSARQVDFQVFVSHKLHAAPTPTLARTLRAAGYATGIVGKYHVGHSLQASDCTGTPSLDAPLSNQHFVRASLLANMDERAAQSCATIGNQSCLAASIGKHAGFEHSADIYYDNDALTFYAHQPEFMTREAVRFVRSARRHRRPYFLWMAPSLTHSPSDVLRQLQAEPRIAPAGCGSSAVLLTSGATAADTSAMVSEEDELFVAAARRTRKAVLARLAKAGLACKKNATEWRICPDQRLPSPSTLLKPEPWLPAHWFQEPGMQGEGRRAGLATSVCQASWLDASLAPLLHEINQTSTRGPGIAEASTLLIFTSDHGPYFAGKGHAFEAGVRVPFLIRTIHSGQLESGGRLIHDRVTHLDVLPTLAALVGLPIPASSDGQPIAALAGHVNSPSLPLFIEVGFSRTVVVDGYKLMLHLLPPSAAADPGCRSVHGLSLPDTTAQNTTGGKHAKVKFEYDARDRHTRHHCDRIHLYHIQSDPAEQHNLAKLEPQQVAHMKELILAHVARVESTSTSNAAKQKPLDAAARQAYKAVLPPPPPDQQHRNGGAPKSWCQTCHPATDCPAWPEESTTTRIASNENSLGPHLQQLIEGHASALIDGLRGNASAAAIKRMVAMEHGVPYAPKDKCILLRAAGGRVLVDFLDSGYGQQQDFSLASCFPSRKGNYLRSRLHIGLRLLVRTLHRMQPLPDFEIGFCPDDCSPALSVNEESTIPALTSVRCAGRGSLPYVAWTVNSNRATDLSEWDSFIDDWARRARTVAWDKRSPKAVFRGHLRPFTVCGGWPTWPPRYNEAVNANNWRVRGRSAIWNARIAHPELLDVNFDNHADMATLWGLNATEAASVDEPKSISMEEQARCAAHALTMCVHGSSARLVWPSDLAASLMPMRHACSHA